MLFVVVRAVVVEIRVVQDHKKNDVFFFYPPGVLFLASTFGGVEDVLMLFPVPSCPDAHPCTADPRRLGKVENWPPRRPQTTKWMPETESPPADNLNGT